MKRHLSEVVDFTRNEPSEVIDLVAAEEEEALQRERENAEKKRIKARQEMQQRRRRQKLEIYLSSMSQDDSQAVKSVFFKLSEEKRDILQRREEFGKESDVLTKERIEMKRTLDNGLMALLNLEESLENNSNVSVVKEKATYAFQKADGARRRLESYRRDEATRKLAASQHAAEINAIMNDPVYQQGRQDTMVTDISRSTNAQYRPLVPTPTANHDMLRRAINNPANPGMLPDGAYVPPHLASLPIEEVAEQYRSTEFMAGSASATKDIEHFEELVELAMTEAEPLDFPPQMLCTKLEHQRQGLGWLIRAERGHNRGGILADDMGLGKTVQTIALMYANPPAPPTRQTGETSETQEFASRLGMRRASSGNPLEKARLNLIVCPVALMNTWEEELRTRVKPEARLRVYRHHSSNKSHRFQTAEQFERGCDVVICSYNGLTSEFKKLMLYREARAKLQEDHNFAAAERLRKPLTPLFDTTWHRVVLDEAHAIKNRQSRASLAAVELQARYRLALTGTPMQNKLEELFPLIRFLHIEPHCNWSQFLKLLPPRGSSTAKAFESQRAMAAFLTATLLRRKKDTKINGRKIIDSLPPKHVEMVETEMVNDGTSQEKARYEALENQIQAEFQRGQALSTIEEQMTMSNMLVYLLRLRQTACHPKLIDITKHTAARSRWGRNEETRQAIGIAMQLNPIYRRNAVESIDDLVCYQCDGPATDLDSTYVLTRCGHVLCSECSSSFTDNGEGGTCICGVESPVLANLEILYVIEKQEPRNAGECLNLLLSFQAPRVEEMRRHAEERRRGLRALQAEAEGHTIWDNWLGDLNSDASESPFDGVLHATDGTSDDQGPRIFGREIISDGDDSDVNSVDGADPKIESGLTNGAGLVDSKFEMDFKVSGSRSELDSVPTSKQEIDSKPETENKVDLPTTEVTGDTKPDPSPEDPADPLKYRIDINKVAKFFKVPKIFDDGWISSAKVESCLDVLRRIWRESPTDKVIIFTTFTSFIDVLTIPMTAAMIQYEEYTGRMNIQDRDDALEKFKSGNCRVLLASLKAGNVGLTLTQANRVIIMEPFWNPYVEEQAQDRVYRIGQSREVTVYKLYVKSTVEDRIAELQKKKREIIDSALDNSTKTRSQGLSRADLMFALGFPK